MADIQDDPYLVVFGLNIIGGLISYPGVPIQQQCTCLDESPHQLSADRWRSSRQNPNQEAWTDESKQCHSHSSCHLKRIPKNALHENIK